MVNSVSFRGVESQTNIQDLIKKPQVYTAQTKAQAASPVEGKDKKKGKAGKVIAGIAVTAAALMTALAFVASKTNILKTAEDATGLGNTIKKHAQTIGEKIAKAPKQVFDFIKTNIDKLNKGKGEKPLSVDA